MHLKPLCIFKVAGRLWWRVACEIRYPFDALFARLHLGSILATLTQIENSTFVSLPLWPLLPDQDFLAVVGSKSHECGLDYQ
jgi:hypothetical protein